MCGTATCFVFKPTEDFPIKVLDLMSHYETITSLLRGRYEWREGTYYPNGVIECKVLKGDTLTSEQCESIIKERYPTYIDFLNFSFEQIGDTYYGCGSDLTIKGMALARGLKFPKKIYGSLILEDFETLEGIKLPEEVTKDFEILTIEMENVSFPKSIGRSLIMDHLLSADGIKFPDFIKGNLYLSRLVLSKGLVLPKEIEGSLMLNSLIRSKGVIFPKRIGGDVYVRSLRNLNGAKLPEHIGGGIFFKDTRTQVDSVRNKNIYLHEGDEHE